MGSKVRATWVMRLSGNLSLLAATSACLATLSGTTLLHAYASIPELPSVDNKPMWLTPQQTKPVLIEILLFWLPLGLGAVACSVGLFTLACSNERNVAASRCALFALIVGAIPGCLCTLWYITTCTRR